MKTYYVHPSALFTSTDGNHVPVYLGTEADARIDQLRGALLSCATVIRMHLKSSEVFKQCGDEAVKEAQKALALMEG